MKAEWKVWLGEKYASFVPAASSALYVAYDSVSTFSSGVLAHPRVRESMLHLFRGATQWYDPESISTLFDAPRTTAILQDVFLTNGKMLLSVLMYEMTSNSIHESLGNYAVVRYPMLALDMTARLGFLLMAARALYRAELDYLALARILPEENQVIQNRNLCDHDDSEVIKAEIFSWLDQRGRQFSLYLAGYLPFVNYLVLPGKIYSAGYSLLEYEYRYKTCTQHRSAHLVQNNLYLFGIGASFYAVAELFCGIIKSRSGVDSIFARNAVYSSLYAWYIAMVLLRSPDGIAKTPGTDYFYFHRYVFLEMAKQGVEKIKSLLSQPVSQSPDWIKVVGQVEKLPLVQKGLALLGLLRENRRLSVFEDFVTNLPHTFIFDACYDSLLKPQLEELDRLRHPVSLYDRGKRAAASVVPGLPALVTAPFVSEDDKRLLQMVLGDELGNPLDRIAQLLGTIRRLQLLSIEERKTSIRVYYGRLFPEAITNFEADDAPLMRVEEKKVAAVPVGSSEEKQQHADVKTNLNADNAEFSAQIAQACNEEIGTDEQPAAPPVYYASSRQSKSNGSLRHSGMFAAANVTGLEKVKSEKSAKSAKQVRKIEHDYEDWVMLDDAPPRALF